MSNRRSKRLVRKGEPSQKTDNGLEIPVSALHCNLLGAERN
jgi:hypothetical protein